ncbi:hypothetical protein A1D31_39540 [Bradyrhizobium liaoningense]|nr:hypothetical protein A1D31_39540 [Bradyrhizobium liaoningense]
MNIKQLCQLGQHLVAFDGSQATFALNAGEYVRRPFFIIFAADSRRDSSPLSGRESTQATVRICGPALISCSISNRYLLGTEQMVK